MKKIRKNDLKLEKEVISRLSQDDLTSVKGGGYKPLSVINVDCFHPISYDGNCKTINVAASCQVSCGGGCTVQSVNIMCEKTKYTCAVQTNISCEGGESVCYCQVP